MLRLTHLVGKCKFRDGEREREKGEEGSSLAS